MGKVSNAKRGERYRQVKLKDGRTVQVKVVKIKRDDTKTTQKGRTR